MAVGKTKTITVSNLTPTAIIAETETVEITVGEDPSVVGWPTQDFKVIKPESTNLPRQIPIGGTYTFKRDKTNLYRIGETVGYVQAVTTATTFFQDERGL